MSKYIISKYRKKGRKTVRRLDRKERKKMRKKLEITKRKNGLKKMYCKAERVKTGY